MNEKVNELAKRLWDYTDPWDREDTTVEDVARQIEEHPLDVIQHLLNLLDA